MARDDDEPRIWALRDRERVAPQTVLARTMRRVPTDAEKKLWWHLHRLSLKGSHFRRQVRLGPYIVDFASHKARVVIEVDGGQHAENAADAVRTKFIEGQGYRVLRFWNNDVLGNIEGVLEVIQATVEAASQGRAAHSSAPPCGEGSGVGVVPHGTAVTQAPDPPPHPSPTRGEGVPAARPNSQHPLSSLLPQAKGEQKRSLP
jgi:very-short-patch-repair endonuclease